MNPVDFRLSPTPVARRDQFVDARANSPELLARSSPALMGAGLVQRPRQVTGGSQMVQSALKIRRAVRSPSPGFVGPSSSHAQMMAALPFPIPSPIDQRMDAAIARAVRCYSPPPQERAAASPDPQLGNSSAALLLRDIPDLPMPPLPAPPIDSQAQALSRRTDFGSSDRPSFVASANPQETQFPRGFRREDSVSFVDAEVDGETHTSGMDMDQPLLPPRSREGSVIDLRDVPPQPDPPTHLGRIVMQEGFARDTGAFRLVRHDRSPDCPQINSPSQPDQRPQELIRHRTPLRDRKRLSLLSLLFSGLKNRVISMIRNLIRKIFGR